MRSVEDTGADWPDWCDDRAYQHTFRLTRREWAWEFLRRNPAFRNDLAKALEGAEWLGSPRSLDIIASRADLTRWGVLFRGLLAA
ncbi:transcriptional regulator domain-containing protein [Mesorhizobium newzealandense]|uniref:Transcriptional regulator domain-containing protein n=3 Tax=Mesorhizobium TaxID=68287 RepID=A0ABW4WBL6_9HYPH|nr:DUF6499 domain-containing protein [Mesorhizobium sophorae]